MRAPLAGVGARSGPTVPWPPRSSLSCSEVVTGGSDSSAEQLLRADVLTTLFPFSRFLLLLSALGSLVGTSSLSARSQGRSTLLISR